MSRKYRWTAGVLATALGMGLIGMGTPGAHASSKGRKNTALILGGVAAYQLLKGKTTTGLVAGAGAVYAYKKYRDKRKEEKRRASSYVSPYRGAGSYGVPYRGAGSVSAPYQRSHQGPPVAWVDGRPIWTRDDYIDERTGLRSGDVQAPGTPYQRYDYGAAARAEAYRNSIYGQAEANMACPPGHRRH
jgi:hypothetical protein